MKYSLLCYNHICRVLNYDVKYERKKKKSINFLVSFNSFNTITMIIII